MRGIYDRLARVASHKLVRDIGERMMWTFLQVFLATFVLTDVSTFRSALIAGFGAALSLLKGYIASHVGQPTAALPSIPQ